MGTGDDIAASRLRLLQAEFTRPGQHREPGVRAAPTTAPTVPLNLNIVDHIRAAAAEVVAQARTDMPETHPHAAAKPAEPAALYDWWRSFPVKDEERQTVRDQVIYRQGLEHAIAMGDDKVVRRHPCPACGCYGLFWQSARRAAVCVNHLCTDDDGISHAWPLKRLAHEHIASQKMLRIRAT
jgi:hypothetical protein